MSALIRVAGAAFVAALLFAGPAAAKSTGVGGDPTLQSGPCYEALIAKNETHPTTAPKRELGAACRAENGDIDKAWDRVMRLWGSDSEELPDYSSYRRADAPVDAVAPKWLATLGILLTYLVLGAPMRAAARLFGAYPGSKRGAAAGVIFAILLRGAVGAAFLLLFALPYVAALGAAALMAWTVVRLARGAAAPVEPASGAFAANAAEAINDLLGAVPSLAALALLTQPSWAMFAAALALALVASLGPVVAGRRMLRATPLRASAASAAFGAILGELLVVTAPVAGWLAGLTGSSLAAPLLLAGITLAAGLALARPVRRMNESGGL